MFIFSLLSARESDWSIRGRPETQPQGRSVVEQDRSGAREDAQLRQSNQLLRTSSEAGWSLLPQVGQSSHYSVFLIEHVSLFVLFRYDLAELLIRLRHYDKAEKVLRLAIEEDSNRKPQCNLVVFLEFKLFIFDLYSKWPWNNDWACQVLPPAVTCLQQAESIGGRYPVSDAIARNAAQVRPPVSSPSKNYHVIFLDMC